LHLALWARLSFSAAQTPMSAATSFTPGVLEELHFAVLQGEVLARQAIAVLLVRRVGTTLHRRMPTVDSAIINDAVEDAILGYLTRPDAFDSSRSRLDTFLSLAASHNVLNALAREDRRRRVEGRAAAEAQAAAKQGALFNDVASRGDPTTIRLFMAAFNPLERQFLSARHFGERRTVELARILRLTHLAVPDQRREVKRETDRLRIRLRRLSLRLR